MLPVDMGMRIAKAVLWALDAVLVVTAVVLVFKVETVSAGPDLSAEPAGSTSSFSSAAWDPLTDDQIEEMLASGAIVPLPKVEPTPSAPTPAPTPVAPQSVDVTRAFQSKLIGTIVEPDAAYAFLEETTGRQLVAKQGQTIGNAKIIGIWTDRILVEIGGQRGYIQVPEREGSQAVASSAPPRDYTPPSTVASLPVPADAGQEEEEYEEEFDEEELDWNVISEAQYLDYIQNIGKYVSQVVVLTHYNEEKQPDGLILTSVPPESEAYKRGLRAGDIVKSVQDQPVTDLQAAIKVAYQVLRDDEYFVEVLIVRDGAEELLSYEVWPE